MQIKDLTTDELKALIRETVSETLQEFLDDPDWGKDLREEVKDRLNQSLKQTEAGDAPSRLARSDRSVSAEEVAKKLGLSW